MQRSEVMETGFLQHSVTVADPIEFVLMEDFLRQQTVRRAPKWRPKNILKAGGWEEYSRGKQNIREVNRLIDEMWMDLVRRLMQLRNDMTIHQAGASLRQMEWAEQFRQRQQESIHQLDTMQKQLRIEDLVAATRDGRLHGHTKELEALRHGYEKELMGIKLGQDAPAYRAQRYLEAVDLFKPFLEQFATGDKTHQVSQQISEAMLDALQMMK